MTITKLEHQARSLGSKIIEPPPTLRHSGQAQRRSGTHAVDGGDYQRRRFCQTVSCETLHAWRGPSPSRATPVPPLPEGRG
jgi:hypothetical protein